MSFYNTYHTLSDDELYAESQRNLNESKSTFLLYNGALDSDDDPADYMAPVKAVRLA